MWQDLVNFIVCLRSIKNYHLYCVVTWLGYLSLVLIERDELFTFLPRKLPSRKPNRYLGVPISASVSYTSDYHRVTSSNCMKDDSSAMPTLMTVGVVSWYFELSWFDEENCVCQNRPCGGLCGKQEDNQRTFSIYSPDCAAVLLISRLPILAITRIIDN